MDNSIYLDCMLFLVGGCGQDFYLFFVVLSQISDDQAVSIVYKECGNLICGDIMFDKDAMPLAVVGCDFRVAPSRYRSALVMDDQDVRRLASTLSAYGTADGFVDLNTCNRNEWIVSSTEPAWAAELLRAQMILRAGPDARAWLKPYVYVGRAAALHVFRVAIGQESLVVGERQIAGQLYHALERARTRGTSSRVLNGLTTAAGRLVRIALRRGCIGDSAVGVHSLAFSVLKDWLKENTKSRARVALVGLGRIGKRLMGMMEAEKSIDPIFVNRTIVAGGPSNVRPLSKLSEILHHVDAVLVATGAPFPVVDRACLDSISRTSPLLFIDIGIPEQVARGQLPSMVEVSGLDELIGHYKKNIGSPRKGVNEEIEDLLNKAMEEYQVYCCEPAFGEILDTVQRHHKQLVRDEIPRIIRQRLDYLSASDSALLEQDLRSIVLEYTTEVFKTIREASLRMVSNSNDDEFKGGMENTDGEPRGTCME